MENLEKASFAYMQENKLPLYSISIFEDGANWQKEQCKILLEQLLEDLNCIKKSHRPYDMAEYAKEAIQKVKQFYKKRKTTQS